MKKGEPGEVPSLDSGLTGAPDSQPSSLPPSSPTLARSRRNAVETGNPEPPFIPDHELLRCIGRGSYGEVWLARSVLGEYRAVKVIHRRALGDNRPFEREFEGIQRYEPISRSHESQVQILHVGINQAEGYFYYVMELADDVGRERSDGAMERWSDGKAAVPRDFTTPTLQDPNRPSHHSKTPPLQHPASYVPRTLRLELERHSRLPLAQCLNVGLALTTALAYLHKQGLVHRDIKPSNIIFVQGRPKLADIGLVTDVGDAQSIVGTEGYLAPEGPGTAQADIYALGMVLYEISTGRDRRHFPDLPLDLNPGSARERSALGSTCHRPVPSGDSPDGTGRTLTEHEGEGAPNLTNTVPFPVGGSPTGAGESPAPPAGFKDRKGLLELNEILLKACARDTRQRYQSAEEMHAELEVLQRGESVRRKRATQRRLLVLKKLSLGVAAVLLVLAAVWFAVDRFSQQPGRARQGQPPKSWKPSPAAKKLYDEAWTYLMKQTKDGIARSIDCFNRAIELEPNYALAYCGLSDAYTSQSEFVVPPIQALPEARKNARRAVEINDSLPDGHLYLGHALLGAYDFASAEIEFKRAVALGPSNAWMHTGYATLLRCLGRTNQARELQQKAFELEPSDRIKLRDWYYQLWSERRFDEAVQEGQKLSRVAPNWTMTPWLLGRAYAACGRLDEAAKELGKARAMDDDPDGAGALGYVYGRLGMTNEARAILLELKNWRGNRYVCAHAEAYIYAGLGEKAEAIRQLHVAYENQCRSLPRLNLEPFWDNLRADPHFVALLRKLGLQM